MCDALVPDAEIERRVEELPPIALKHATPWQEIYRATVGQLADGAALEAALKYRDVAARPPRHNH